MGAKFYNFRAQWLERFVKSSKT